MWETPPGSEACPPGFSKRLWETLPVPFVAPLEFSKGLWERRWDNAGAFSTGFSIGARQKRRRPPALVIIIPNPFA